MKCSTRKLVIALLLAATAAALPAQAADPISLHRSYSTDDVMSALGKKRTPGRPPPLRIPGGFHARLSSNVDCGRLRLNFNMSDLTDDFAAFFKQLPALFDAVMAAAPMLILCQGSPSVCAEVKNLNYQLNEDLKGMLDVCHAMDNFIDKQANVGKAKAWEECVKANGNNTSAQKKCSKTEQPLPLLYDKIASAWDEETPVTADQPIVGSLLKASGQLDQPLGQERYDFLASVLGELTLNKEGKVYPIFAVPTDPTAESSSTVTVRPTTVASLSKSVAIVANAAACNQSDLDAAAQGNPPQHLHDDPSTADPETLLWRAHMADIIKEQINHRDVQNLWLLDQPDRELACNALGRALARATLQRLADDGEAAMAIALQNRALDEELRRTYESRSRTVFSAMRTQRFEGAQHTLPQVLQLIARMAGVARETNQLVSAAISRGQRGQNLDTPCTDSKSCDQ
jgi:hypothetical protein